MAVPETPKSRDELFLAKVAGQDVTLPTPVSREEMFLAKAAGEDVETPTPVSREELYLDAIAQGGGGGGGDSVTYEDITFRAISTGTGQLNIFYWDEVDGDPAGSVVALTLNTNHTIHVQVVNGNVQLTSQTSTSGWVPYYNDKPLETLLNTNRTLGFKLPPEYTPGEIIKLIH